MTDQNGHAYVHNYYDMGGRVTRQMTDGEGNTTLYTYDLSGNMVSITDPTGEMELYSYDREGRVAEKQTATGSRLSLPSIYTERRCTAG